jgi:AraC family transcriptional regulator
MHDERVEATSRVLYEGSHVTCQDFVTSGRKGLPWQWAEHTHEAIQITIISLQSRVQADWLTDSGRKCQKRISGPAICVTPGLQPHSIDWDEALGSMMIVISPELIGEQRGCGAGSVSLVQEGYGACDPFVQHLGSLLTHPSDAGLPVTRLQAESTAVILLEHLRGRVERSHPRISSSCGRLSQVIEYIHANLEAELSIVALARIAQTSPFYFARQFKASLGVTPHRYVLERRIDRVRLLLLDSHASIAEVANSCGFATQAHMTTAFHRFVGMTPKAYRTSIGAN